ncbi:DUF6585 family protein [Streptomyces sp. NPDC048430]|uniref:DUF6585 family protein n=1 Tax=Streptomyces sp. NPDC048430 TaxID=3155388 RepID=UPI003414F92F
MTETGPAPAPTEPVTALAAERDLGAWAQWTFVPKKGVFLRRWEGARLYFFHRGLVVTGPEGFSAAYDWGTASVLECVAKADKTVTDARYTVVDRDGAAVGIGRGTDFILPGQRDRLGITSLVKGAPFTFEGDWGPHIQRRILLAQMPGVLARIERGESVQFGAVRLGGAGVSVKGRSAAWGDLEEIRAVGGLLEFHGVRGRKALPRVYTAHVANLYLFLAVCGHMRSPSGPGAAAIR